MNAITKNEPAAGGLAPKPGIYHDVPFEDYLAWDAISNSRIKLAMQSMQHFRCKEATEETKALKLGSFIHCGILEQLAIAQRYAVIPPYHLDKENVTKDGKNSKSTATSYVEESRNAFMLANDGKKFVEQKEYDDLIGISKSLARDESARKYLNGQGSPEVSIVWHDNETGVLCKARIDYLTDSAIDDLKTTENASQEAFERSMANYGYHRQAAHYIDGYATLTGRVLPFVVIAVEKTSPYAVSAQPIDDEAIEVGSAERLAALEMIRDSRIDDRFPGYKLNGKWRLPSWYQGPSVALTMNGEIVSS